MFRINAKKIRQLMFAQQLSLTKLAKLAHLQKNSVARLFKDGAKVKTETVGKIAAALGVDGEEIILEQQKKSA